MSFARVVAATDFSEPSDRALAVAAHWAGTLGIPLVIAHVYSGAPFPLFPSETVAKAVERQAREQLAALDASILAGVPHEIELREHPSASLGLCDLARTDDLLVVGTHGRTGMRRMLIGSVAEQVIRHAGCTVLAIRGDFDVANFPRRVLVCTDFSDAASPALYMGANIARAFSARATLLHAVTEDEWRSHTQDADDIQIANVEQALETRLRELAATLPHADTAFVVAHSLTDAIIDKAVKTESDLVILATHGRTGLARLVIGSVTERVTRHAHCPILIARSHRS